MIGPGKYDELATYVRETAQAETAVVLILQGNDGSGFSVQTTKPLGILPGLLRRLADEIENDESTIAQTRTDRKNQT